MYCEPQEVLAVLEGIRGEEQIIEPCGEKNLDETDFSGT